MMKRLSVPFFFFVLFFFIGIVSCSRPVIGHVLSPQEPTALPKEGKEMSESKPIELTMKQQQYITTCNDFAFRLAATVEKDDPGNVLLSPLSAACALGMMENGAAQSTRRQIAAVLGFTDADENAMNDCFHRLLTGMPEADASIRIEIANAILANDNFPLKNDFKNAVGSHYLAHVQNLDFVKSDVADIINTWAKRHTHGMIPHILDEAPGDAALYAMNAIYFKGDWTNEFDKKETRPEEFHARNGKNQKVQMMHRNNMMNYAVNDDFSVVYLPYGNSSYSMEILLPAEGKSIADVLTSLNGERWQNTLQSLQKYHVDLKLPKFGTEYFITLNRVLKRMGITEAFQPAAADFSRLSKVPAFISRVLQKCKIEVDEQGSEAAAVTVVEMRMTSVQPHPSRTAIFHADRPFIYLITENSTGSILFIGTKTE